MGIERCLKQSIKGATIQGGWILSTSYLQNFSHILKQLFISLSYTTNFVYKFESVIRYIIDLEGYEPSEA